MAVTNNYGFAKIPVGSTTYPAQMDQFMDDVDSTIADVVTNPTWPITQSLTVTAEEPGGFFHGMYQEITLNPSSSYSTNTRGHSIHMDTQNNSTPYPGSQITPFFARLRHYGSGTMNEARGAVGAFRNEGTATVTNGMGVYGFIGNTSTGIISEASGLKVEVQQSGAGTISNLKGLNVKFSASNPNNGTITNTYGVFIDDITFGTQTNQAYSLYASDPNTRNYFAGRVGVGTPTPEAPFHVVKGLSGAPTDPNSVLVIESNTWTALEIKAPSDKTSEIFFTDTDYINGAISYDHPNETLVFSVNRVFAAEIVGNGISSQSNVGLFATGSYGGGKGVLGVANAATVPASNPTGGGILYSEGGAGKWRGSSGTVTTFGPAEPHCPDCGRDFALEWTNEQYGNLTICMWCFTDGMTKGVIRKNGMGG